MACRSKNLGGKGIIDLSILYAAGQLGFVLHRLQDLDFQDQMRCVPFPAERSGKEGAVCVDGQRYLIYVHVIAKGSLEYQK